MEWYEAEVRELERSARSRVRRHPAVFYGSSSIRMWTTIAQDLHDPRTLNLGFGGSTLEACLYFFDRLVPPVKPMSLTVYAGDNDLGDGRRPEQVFGWFRELLAKAERRIPAVPFGFISIKPSPARAGIFDRIRRANEWIEAELAGRPGAFYVDVFGPMLAGGKPRSDLFLGDGLHLSPKGYALWTELLEPWRNRIFIEDCLEGNGGLLSCQQDESGVSQVVQPPPEP